MNQLASVVCVQNYRGWAPHQGEVDLFAVGKSYRAECLDDGYVLLDERGQLHQLIAADFAHFFRATPAEADSKEAPVVSIEPVASPEPVIAPTEDDSNECEPQPEPADDETSLQHALATFVEAGVQYLVTALRWAAKLHLQGLFLQPPSKAEFHHTNGAVGSITFSDDAGQFITLSTVGNGVVQQRLAEIARVAVWLEIDQVSLAY